MTKRFFLLLFFLIISTFYVFSQRRFTLSGSVSEASSNETMIGVTIAIPELKTGVATNEYGFYSITLPEGEYELQVNYLGYQDQTRKISLTENTKVNFLMVEQAEQLEEVIVTDTRKKLETRKPQMSVNTMQVATIKKIPVVFGEADVIKSLVLLPGVTNAGEGASGFNVRGGAADQNLILLDEAIIFNSSHLFGFFSVFNPDAIKDVKLYKGGIPSRYGGRVSSVLDIFQKEGNSKNLKVNGGIGAVASRLLIEGPIIKDKAAFLIGGRASYAHLALPLFDVDNRAYFFDLNTKINYKLNERNSLFLSGYFGRDVFSISDSFENTYGNTVGNFRWNHLFSDKLFSNLSLIYSDYYYGLKLDFVGFNWNSGIQNFNVKYDLKHYVKDNLQINYGLNNIYYQFNPGKIEPTNSSSGINPDQLDKKYAFEPAVYIDIEQTLSDNISINYGIRYSAFYRLGKQEINTYLNNEAVVFDTDLQIYEKATPTGTESFGKNETIASFGNFEPRVSVSYALNDNEAIKASLLLVILKILIMEITHLKLNLFTKKLKID